LEFGSVIDALKCGCPADASEILSPMSGGLEQVLRFNSNLILPSAVVLLLAKPFAWSPMSFSAKDTTLLCDLNPSSAMLILCCMSIVEPAAFQDQINLSCFR
jgi:hypothetical protein